MRKIFPKHKAYIVVVILVIAAFCAVLISYKDIYRSNKTILTKNEKKVLDSDIAYGKKWMEINFSAAEYTVTYNVAMIRKSLRSTLDYLKQNNFIVKDTESIFHNKLFASEFNYLQSETAKIEVKKKRT